MLSPLPVKGEWSWHQRQIDFCYGYYCYQLDNVMPYLKFHIPTFLFDLVLLLLLLLLLLFVCYLNFELLLFLVQVSEVGKKVARENKFFVFLEVSANLL